MDLPAEGICSRFCTPPVAMFDLVLLDLVLLDLLELDVDNSRVLPSPDNLLSVSGRLCAVLLAVVPVVEPSDALTALAALSSADSDMTLTTGPVFEALLVSVGSAMLDVGFADCEVPGEATCMAGFGFLVLLRLVLLLALLVPLVPALPFTVRRSMDAGLVTGRRLDWLTDSCRLAMACELFNRTDGLTASKYELVDVGVSAGVELLFVSANLGAEETASSSPTVAAVSVESL